MPGGPDPDLAALHRLYGATNAYLEVLRQARPSAERLSDRQEAAGLMSDNAATTVEAAGTVVLRTTDELRRALRELLGAESGVGGA
jgi:hypothetical protein